MEPIHLYRTHTQDFIALMISMIFIVCGIYALTLPMDQIADNGRIIVWLLMSLFISIAIFSIMGLLSKKPMLTLDRDGLTDNASGLSVGFIPWSDVIGCEIVTLQAQKYVGLSLRTPNHYLNRAPLVKRMLMRSNARALGHVVNIPQSSLPVPCEELLLKIREFSRIA